MLPANQTKSNSTSKANRDRNEARDALARLYAYFGGASYPHRISEHFATLKRHLTIGGALPR